MGEGFSNDRDRTAKQDARPSPISGQGSTSTPPKTPETKEKGLILKWAIGAIVFGAIAMLALSQDNLRNWRPLVTLKNWRSFIPENDSSPIVTDPLPPPQKAVSGLGRIEPKGETIFLSEGQGIGQSSNKLKALFVEVGDRVRQGQAIAILDSRDRLLQSLAVAQQEVKIAQANLAQVKAGAKTGDLLAQQAEIARLEAEVPRDLEAQQATIDRLDAQRRGDILTQNATLARLEAQLNGDITAQEATIRRLQAEIQGNIQAQQATIERLKAELANAEIEDWRHEQLYLEGAISQSLFDSKRLAAQTARERLEEARVILTEIMATGQEQINEAEATLTRISRTGIKQIEEVRANLERIKQTADAEIAQAQTTLKRIRETGEEQINRARSTLDSLAEVRPVDVQAAETEVALAIASVAQAQVELDLAYIKSPINGRVLDVFTRPGESISNNGIVEIGQTQEMYVVAEIYETDISQVRLGQRAEIISDAIADELEGTVEQIGWKIGKRDILDTDPAADVDVRVVEVKIRLDREHSQKVSGLTNLQVEVKIFIE